MFTICGRNYETEVTTNSDGIKAIRRIPKKYDLIYDRIESMRRGRKLYRIRARRDFETSCGRIGKGEIGGVVENTWNLSHEGSCWIHYDSCVYGQTYIIDNAYVTGNSGIYSSNTSYIGNETYIRDSSISVNGHINIFADNGSMIRPSIASSHICVKDETIDIAGKIAINHSIIKSSVKCNICGVDRFNIDSAKIYLYNTDESKLFSGVTISDSNFDSFESTYGKGIVISNTVGIDTQKITVYTDGTLKVGKKKCSTLLRKRTLLKFAKRKRGGKILLSFFIFY